MYARIRSFWRNLVHRRQADLDVDEEVGTAFALAVEEKIRAGMDPERARRDTTIEFGRPAAVAEQVRGARSGASLDTLWRDLSFGFRLLRRSPLLAATAVASLAIGIGATTTIFSLVNALMLRDLRVGNPGELIEIGRITQYGRGGGFSYPIYRTLRDDNAAFSGLIAEARSTLQAASESSPAPVGRLVSENFFEVLQVPPAQGRVLGTADAGPGTTVAVLSHGFWQREFAGRQAIGERLQVEGVPFTIVGVLPATFDDPIVGRPTDFYLPMAAEPLLRRQSWLGRPDFNWLVIVGRLGSDTSIEAARSNLDPIFARILADIARDLPNPTAKERFLSHRLALGSARAGISDLRRRYTQPVLLLMTAVTLVLLIACTNVVNLLLARGIGRRREMALRLAIGAGRGRLVRQLLTEALLLGTAGGAGGFLLAQIGAPLLVGLAADGPEPFSLRVQPDTRILAFTVAVAVGASILAGLIPALRTSKADLTADFDAGGRTLSFARGSLRWSRALIALQVALSLMLLIGASLVLVSLRNMRTFDAGFDREHTLLVGVNPIKAGYTDARYRQYFRDALTRVRAIPGVRAAGVSMITPISGGGIDLPLTVEGRSDAAPVDVYVNRVSDGFLEALGVPLRSGRTFALDDERRPVVIVNEALANRFFKGQNPVGERIVVGKPPGSEIVGVVASSKYLTLREPDMPTAYFYAPAEGDQVGLAFTIATHGDPRLLAQTIREELQSLAPTVPVPLPHPFARDIDRSLVTERLMARLLGAFALCALVLAAVGLYGVLGYSVARRTGEIGLRLALGASRADVLRGVLRESALLVTAGVVLGVPAALVLSRGLTSLLFNITPADPLVLAGCVACLFIVATLAAAVPAWRASRVEPLDALKGV